MISQDFGWFRMHAGCGAQDGEALPFVGLDKTFRIAKGAPAASDGKSMKKHTAAPAAPEMRDLFTLRTDAIRMRNHDWLLSAGVLIPVCKNFVFETWGNFPTDGTDASLTLKANFVFSF